MLPFVAVAAGFIVLLIVGLAFQVDDWSRDLSSNHAATSNEATRPWLRPVEIQEPVDVVVARVKQAALTLPLWELVEENDIESGKQLHFVRTTRWLRFKDDITVRVTTTEGGGSVVHAESRSRIGKGDLGQNPRNIREMMAAIMKGKEIRKSNLEIRNKSQSPNVE